MTLLLAVLSSAGAWADVVTVGDPKNDYGHMLPIGCSSSYALTQQVYTTEEFSHAAGKIWSIGFNTVNGDVSRHLSIYVTHTDKSGVYGYTPVTENDLYFSGDMFFKAGQWNTLDFNKPFEYDGTSNLLITICDDTGKRGGSYNSLTNRFYNPQSTHLIYATNDNQAYDPTDANEATDFTSISSWKAQIRLTFTDNPTPTNFTVGDIADVSAQLQCSLRGEATAWNLRYRKAGATDLTTVNGLTTRSKTIEGLTPATKYEAQVQAVFEGDNLSEWTTSLEFVTSCCPLEQQSEILFSAVGNSGSESAFKIVDHETGLEVAYVKLDNYETFGGSLTLCCGRTYDVYWVSNKSYPGSDSWFTFTLFFLPGDEFYSMKQGEAPEAPNGEEGKSYLLTSFVMDCEEPCTPMPRFLTASDVTYQGATLTYQPSTTKEEIQYSTDPAFPTDMTKTVKVTRASNEKEISYLLNGLESLTIYYIRVRSECDDNGQETGDKFSRWTKPVQVITDSKYAPPTRPIAEPVDPKSEDVSWSRLGMESKNNVNYRTAGQGKPAGEPIIIDLDGDGESFEKNGEATYESYGKKGVDNVIGIANVPAGSMVSWSAANLMSSKTGSNTVTFSSGFYKQSKKFNEGEETAAKEKLTRMLQQQKQEEQEAQQSTDNLQELLKEAKELEREIMQIEEEGGVPYKQLTKHAFLRAKIKALQQASQTTVEGSTSAVANGGEEQSSQARQKKAPTGTGEEEEYYFFFIRHTDPDEILAVKDITVTSPENIGDWITIPNVKDVEYTLKNLKPGTAYEVMVEPVYDSGLVGLASPITIFRTVGQEAEPMEGEFSVGQGKKVQFAKGNLQHNDRNYNAPWSFATHQYDVLGDANVGEPYATGSVYPADKIDLLSWSTTGNGSNGSTFTYRDDKYFKGDFAEWGIIPEFMAKYGTGWRTLSKDEWTYLLTERENADKLKSFATVAEVGGLILLPDDWTGTAPAGTYTAEGWTTLENSGAVFLPVTGHLWVYWDEYNKTQTAVNGIDAIGNYWSSTPSGDQSELNAFAMRFNTNDSELTTDADTERRLGCAVRLVKEVTAVLPSVVTVTSVSREYGDANPEFEYTVEGGALNGTPEISSEAKPDSPIGEYTITIDKGTVTNEEVTFVGGKLTVTKAPLTISAENFTIKQGEALPAFVAAYKGFKNNETEAVLKTKPTVTCTATAASEPGKYDITVSGATADNYEISYVKGTLRIRSLQAELGDLNDDGDIDVTDVVELIDMVLAGIYDPAGDINGDGEVDVTDVVELIDMVLSGD